MKQKIENKRNLFKKNKIKSTEKPTCGIGDESSFYNMHLQITGIKKPDNLIILLRQHCGQSFKHDAIVLCIHFVRLKTQL